MFSLLGKIPKTFFVFVMHRWTWHSWQHMDVVHSFNHVHLVTSLWALYQMPNCSLARDCDALSPNSKSPSCQITSCTEKNQSPKYSKYFFASIDPELVLLGNICHNFDLLGTTCMKSFKWLSFPHFFKSISTHKFAHLAVTKNHYNRVRS